jgi:hypothetical protein
MIGFRYSYGNTVKQASAPLSIGAPLVHASGAGLAVVEEDEGAWSYALWQLYQRRRKERELKLKIGRDFEDVLLL